MEPKSFGDKLDEINKSPELRDLVVEVFKLCKRTSPSNLTIIVAMLQVLVNILMYLPDEQHDLAVDDMSNAMKSMLKTARVLKFKNNIIGNA